MILLKNEEFIHFLANNFERNGVHTPVPLPEGITAKLGIPYGKDGDTEISLDLFFKSEKPEKKRSAMVFVYGGGFRAGNSYQFHPQAAYFALKYDMVTVCVNYRKSPEVRFPKAVQDVKCAIRWLRFMANDLSINVNRIAVCGGSAGGNLAAMAATTGNMQEFEGEGGHQAYSSRANLCICLNAAFEIPSETVNNVNVGENYIGRKIEEAPELFASASPMNHINSDMCPMLILHGSHDNLVSFTQSQCFYDRCVDLGVPVEIEIFDGKGHGWFNFYPDLYPVILRMDKFVSKYFRLKNEE